MTDALDPKSLLQQLEQDSTTPAYKRGESFRRLAEFYKANGDEGTAERMATLAHVFTGIAVVGPRRFSDKKPRFMAQFGWSDGSSSPVFEVMTPARWNCVREFRDQSANPIHRARLSDFMWEGLKDHEAARDAIAAYLTIARRVVEGGGDDWAAADAAVRAIELSALINDAVSMASAAETCPDLARRAAGAGGWRPATDLIRELLASPKQVRSLLDLTELTSLCESAVTACPPEPLRDSEREWLALLERLHALQGSQDGVRGCRARIAATYEAEGDFWADEAHFMPNAAVAYDRAVEAWKRVRGSEDAVARVINKLAAATRASHGDTKVIETPVTISAEDMEAWKAGVLDQFARHGIAILSNRGYILPDPDSIEPRMREAHESVPLRSLIQRTAVHDDRLVDRTSCPEENLDADVRSYMIWELAHASLQTAMWVFEAIVARGDSVPKEVIGFIKASSLIAEWRHDLLAHALDAYGRGDHIASVHVLAFQVEGIVRDLAVQVGLPRLTRDKEGRTQLRYLPHLLGDERLIQAFGRRLTLALAAVLTEQAGLNVRNLIGHGEAPPELFSRGTNEILIILLLVLAGLRKEERGEGESQRPADGNDTPSEAEPG